MITEEVQLILALRHVHNILAMQGVLAVFCLPTAFP